VAGRRPSSIVRVQGPEEGQRARLFIGKQLWRDSGEPRHVNLLADGPRLLIQPCDPGTGYTVVGGGPNAMPRVSIGEEMRELLGLDEGTYPAVVETGRIVVTMVQVDKPPAPTNRAPIPVSATPHAPETPRRPEAPTPAAADTLPAREPGRVVVRGRSTLLSGRVAAHQPLTAGDRGGGLYDVAIQCAGKDSIHILSVWPGLRDQLRVGDHVEIEVRRVGENDAGNR